MGLFDRAKKLAEEHSDQVAKAIDKVAHVVDGKTGGKYGDQIGKGAAAAKNFVDGDGEHVTVDGDGGVPAAPVPAPEAVAATPEAASAPPAAPEPPPPTTP